MPSPGATPEYQRTRLGLPRTMSASEAEVRRENAKLREDKARLRNAVRNMMLSLGADNPEQAKWTGESILKEIH